jgi:hypothetical protein
MAAFTRPAAMWRLPNAGSLSAATRTGAVPNDQTPPRLTT